MPRLTDRSCLPAKTLVLAPIAVLSVMFVFGAFLLARSSALGMGETALYIIAGGVAYALAVLVLCRFGLNRIEKLEQMGLTDPLSLLPNRRSFHDDVQRHLKRHCDIALALVDLDGFKLVNDHYGHFVGDMLIGSIGQTLGEVCGCNARAYRLGGDEFAIVTTGPLAPTILEGLCRSLLTRLAAPVALDDRKIVIGASIGITRGAGVTSSSEMLRQADLAMYASKRGGKMRCTWFVDDFDRDLETSRVLDDELRCALTGGELHVHYQPLVDACTRRVVAVEALIRWHRPDGRAIGPDVFIPVAEESGLINAIGLFVLRTACTDALAWDGIRLSVNISVAQLRNPEFPIALGQILEETGFPADRLEIEITETCLVLDPVVAERSLQLIRNFGVDVVLDDFGTGYASIGFLRQFRFEKLKLDRSLIADAEGCESSRAVMLSSISVARAMKMDVTAEGVETQSQADLARAAGCDNLQGWLYFRAMPAHEVTALLCAPYQRKIA